MPHHSKYGFRLCDVCEKATLNDMSAWYEDVSLDSDYLSTGKLKALCHDCVKTHDIVIIERPIPPNRVCRRCKGDITVNPLDGGGHC